MDRGYFDAEKYFQRWAEKQKKEVEELEQNISLIENPETMEECTENMHRRWRKGLSEEEWSAYQERRDNERTEILKRFMESNTDYDYNGILDVLQFKLRWVIFHMENFGHLESNRYDAGKMRVAVNLIDIIQNEGGNKSEGER